MRHVLLATKTYGTALLETVKVVVSKSVKQYSNMAYKRNYRNTNLVWVP